MSELNCTELDQEVVPRLGEFCPCSVPYHICLSLPAVFMQPGNHLLAVPCSTVHLTLQAPGGACGGDEAVPAGQRRDGVRPLRRGIPLLHARPAPLRRVRQDDLGCN